MPRLLCRFWVALEKLWCRLHQGVMMENEKHSILTPTKNEMKDVETSSPAPKEPKTRSESWTDIYKLI